jgi:calcineurin-like phosphoesterase family protein
LVDIFDQLPGARKHLVVGNHDGPLTQELPWDSVSKLVEVPDGPKNQAHTLCHYPMITWNQSRKGTLQMFGHVHENWRGTQNSVNVGVDAWKYMPVRFEDVARRATGMPVNKHWKDVEPRSA